MVKSVFLTLGASASVDPCTTYHDIEESILFEFEEDRGPYTDPYIHHIWATDGSDLMGRVTCEQDNGCLGYLVGSALRIDARRGFYISEACTLIYIRGEWGFTDDDVELYLGPTRPATMPEIVETVGLADSDYLPVMFQQLWLALLHLWGVRVDG